MPVYHKPTPRVPSARKCSVCLEDVTHSKRLACDHTFCSPCLRHQISRLSDLIDREERVTIVCPYCREYFLSSVSFLKDDSAAYNAATPRSKSSREIPIRPKTAHGHVTTEYRAHYSGDRKAERCQPCAEGAMYELATFWCQNCSEYLCSLCAKYHQAMKMSRGHIVKTIRDKERYGSIRAKVNSTPRPQSAREVQQQDRAAKMLTRYNCEPCGLSKKNKDAKFLCDNCKEQMCDDCARCHRSMKMSKGHRLIAIKEVLTKSETNFSLNVKCDRHYGEALSLFCKRCKTSCCSICAITLHANCGKAMKMTASDVTASAVTTSTAPVGKVEPSVKSKFEKDTGPIKYSWDKLSSKGATEERTVSFSIKGADAVKSLIPKNRMEVRRRRIEVDANRNKDWVISMAVLTSGDILVIQLYEPTLKLIASDGSLVSMCRFYGDPWSVAVHNDALAVVSFSDRKQLQLIHVTRNGLESGKKFSTRHKCLAVCFAKNLIAASCWEGCVHVMNVTGEEMCTIDSDHRGDRLFTNPEYIASDRLGTTLYVTDYKRNAVTALTLLPSKIISKPVFVLKHKDLQGPKGVAVDRNGAVYVSGMSSRNIFRLTPSGDVIQVYRRREDTEYYEAIAVSSGCDKLFVSAYEDCTIIEYKLTK